jgi:hypothetical protein
MSVVPATSFATALSVLLVHSCLFAAAALAGMTAAARTIAMTPASLIRALMLFHRPCAAHG